MRPSGGIAWLFTNAVVVREDGRPVRMVGATLDITARKSAEIALRESESRFRTLASHAPATPSSIRTYLEGSPEWRGKLGRSNFSDEQIARVLSHLSRLRLLA